VLACSVNPQEWLTDVFSLMPQHNNDYSLDLAEMLPLKWKASKPVQQNPRSLQE
jgi:transposase